MIIIDYWRLPFILTHLSCVLLQSLDYDNIENQLFLEEERRMSHMVNRVGHLNIH